MSSALVEVPEHPQAADVCPACGAQLAAEQEWCLACGAAARTRLAATPRWRLPLVIITLVIVISLVVIVASLVRLTRPALSSPPITAPTATKTVVTTTTLPASAAR
jgi:hypothetical protein